MRYVGRILLLGCLLAGPFAAPAAAVSIDDLFHLKANGLGDEILVALIETDGSSFHLSAAEILALSKRGLSDAVILAMVESGRRSARVPAPLVEVRSAQEPERQIQHVVVEPAVVHVQQVVEQVQMPAAPVLVAVPVAVPVFRPERRPEPEYWGFGGRLRPDAWQPAPPAPRDSKPATPSSRDRR